MKKVLCLLFATAVVLSSVEVVTATSASVFSNVDSFKSPCGGYLKNSPSPYPAKKYNLAMQQFSKLGYSPTGYLGDSFTSSAFLNAMHSSFAVYVASHGDLYWDSGSPYVNSAFSQNPPGACESTTNRVYSIYGHGGHATNIQANAVPPYYVVIMSTCRLGWDGPVKNHSGYRGNTMPMAFGIASGSTFYYTKTSTQPQFYMGYRNFTWDSSAYAFESNFWAERWTYDYDPGNTGWPSLAQAFDLALADGPYEDVPASKAEDGVYNYFVPAWFGNPNSRGLATGA